MPYLPGGFQSEDSPAHTPANIAVASAECRAFYHARDVESNCLGPNAPSNFGAFSVAYTCSDNLAVFVSD